MMNSRGSSLLILTMLIGILTIASYSWMQMSSNHLKNVKTLQTNYELDAFISQLQVFLSLKGVCSQNLGNISIGNLQSSSGRTLDELVDANGVVRYSTGSSYGNDTLQFTSMTYGGSDTKQFYVSSDVGNRSTATITYYQFPVTVNVENRSSIFGSGTHSINMEALARFDENNKLTRCQIKMAGGDSYWEPADDLDNTIYGIKTAQNLKVGLSQDADFEPQTLLHIEEDDGRSLKIPDTETITVGSEAIPKSPLNSTIVMTSPTTDKVETGTFKLTSGSDTLVRVRLTSSNEGSDSFETGVRTDIVKGTENKAAAFSLRKHYTLEDNEDDDHLRARIRFAYWESGGTHSGAQARVFNSSGKSSPQAIAYMGAKVGGNYRGGYFEGRVGFLSTACSSCSVIAEMMEVETKPQNGTLMCINRKSGKLKACDKDKSSYVVGIAQENAEMILRKGCSETLKKDGRNGLVLGSLDSKAWRKDQQCKGWYPIAMAGLSENTHVLCRRPDGSLLERGDLLVSSNQRVGFLRSLNPNESVLDYQIAGRAMDECKKNKNGQTLKSDVIDVLVKYK